MSIEKSTRFDGSGEPSRDRTETGPRRGTDRVEIRRGPGRRRLFRRRSRLLRFGRL